MGRPFDAEEDRKAELMEVSEVDLNYRLGEGERAHDVPHRTMDDCRVSLLGYICYQDGELSWQPMMSVNRQGE